MKTERKKKLRIGALIAALLIPLAAGGFSAFLTAGDMDLYESMSRPALAPPGWLFPIAWTVLYVMMGVASYLVYVSDAPAETKRKAFRPYIAQLAMNFFWSTLFFTYNRFLTALIWLLLMWVLVLITMIRFFRISRASGLMMCGLLLWLTFAAYLNLACYVLSVTPMPLTV